MFSNYCTRFTIRNNLFTMTILRQLITKTYLLFSRDTPDADCYTVCNNAYLEAEKIGKTAALCDIGSVFRLYVASCESCEGNNGTYLAELEPFTDYCDAADPIPISNQTGASSTSYSAVPTVLPYTATVGGILTTWLFTTTITLHASIPSTTVVQITQTVDGELRTFTFKTTYANLPTTHINVSSGATQSTNITSISSPTYNPEPAKSTNGAWIAGPAVGGVAGAVIIVLGGFFLWRHKRKKREPPTELESHGASEAKPELEATNPPQELDTASLRAIQNRDHTNEPHELAANG
ncbi:hypothetical protein F4781DRAFT_418407 [Annulohypoxylon bovei var. microspora]|nr:hypothetical protein F4781DRAFT_418407 [Annulohypoxylon bovei var. microspora]